MDYTLDISGLDTVSLAYLNKLPKISERKKEYTNIQNYINNGRILLCDIKNSLWLDRARHDLKLELTNQKNLWIDMAKFETIMFTSDIYFSIMLIILEKSNKIKNIIYHDYPKNIRTLSRFISRNKTTTI